MIYRLSILLFLLINSQLEAQNCKTKAKDFKVDSVTKLVSHSGVYGGGSTVSYRIYVTVKKKSLKSIDSAWSQDKSTNVMMFAPPNTSVKDLVIKKKKQMVFVVNINYNNDPPTDGTYIRVPKPINCSDELIISYKSKKKKKYLSISNFIVLPTVNMP